MSPQAKVSREMLIVTGMSGAGRSTVGNALEDLGWYVVDNLPPQMLKPLVDLAGHTGEAIPKVAAMVDVRGGKLFADVLDALEILRRKTNVRVLFLDATDATLVRRFEQVRRPHPLQGDGTLLDGITAERARISELRELSDFIIDTTDLNIHQLSTRVQEMFADEAEVATRVTVMSFGFKYGLPPDADLVADCRFLPNPFWIPELSGQTGLDEPVRDYVLGQPITGDFLRHLDAMLALLLPAYVAEGKSYLTIAMGCTGGHHRSVVMAEEVAALLRARGFEPRVSHRDIDR